MLRYHHKYKQIRLIYSYISNIYTKNEVSFKIRN